MRQAPRSSSATLAKYTGWVTALGRRAGETGAKRIAGARDERRLLTLQRTLFHLGLLIIDEMGFVPLSPTRAELLLEVFSQRYWRGSIWSPPTCPSTSEPRSSGRRDWPECCWTASLAHLHILEMNGNSYRLKRSRETAAYQVPDDREGEQRAPPTLSLPAPLTYPLRPIYCHQSSRQLYTITPPQWPNISGLLKKSDLGITGQIRGVTGVDIRDNKAA